jgi:subtilisin-like proprotein convertase family protein
MSSKTAIHSRRLFLAGVLAAISIIALFLVMLPSNVDSVALGTSSDQISTPTTTMSPEPIKSTPSVMSLPKIAAEVHPAAPTADNAFSFSLVETVDSAQVVALGDLDNDGDLDLASGSYDQPIYLYRNDNGAFTSSPAWESIEKYTTHNIAWGDVDRDGDLDLAIGATPVYSPVCACTIPVPNRVYRNDNGALTSSATWLSNETDSTQGIAWGDVDGDGDLDLAVGNGEYSGARARQPLRLYRNENGILTPSTTWSSVETDTTWSIAWGDVEGDGDLDLAAGNSNHLNLYRNNGGILTANSVWTSTDYLPGWNLAWGDVDSDGYPDLVAVGDGGVAGLYRNNNGALGTSAAWMSNNLEAYSVAWGDADSDGDLDLAVGGIDSIHIYQNDSGQLSPSPVWSSTIEGDSIMSLAWGDIDNDGDIDLIAGNYYGPSRIYRNNGIPVVPIPAWISKLGEPALSVAWGDVDNDGDLDLAIGNGGYTTTYRFNHLYRNDNGGLTVNAVWTSTENDYSSSAAWGDVDNDGDLDLAVGTGYYNASGPDRLYRNDNGVLNSSSIWSSAESDKTWSVAWGDVDNDSDLDLAVGNYDGPARLYRNDYGMLTLGAAWSSVETDTQKVAWGDIDNDGDLDLAVGGSAVRIYLNAGGVLLTNATQSLNEPESGLAWGDVDSDGDLDLAVGGSGAHLYRNDNGLLSTDPIWSSLEANLATDVVWVDVDGDGDLDLSVGDFGFTGARGSYIYRNDNGVLTPNGVWSSRGDGYSVAWGDVDNDGALDLVEGNGNSYFLPLKAYLNGRGGRYLPGSIPMVQVARAKPNADFYSDPKIRSGIIPITYTLSDPQGDPVNLIRAWYSTNGGGKWDPAVATSGTVTSNLATVTMNPALVGRVITATPVSTTPLIIADLSTVLSTLPMAQGGLIADLDAVINLTHTNDGDLIISLTAPSGMAVRLFNRQGGSGDNLTNTVFDDEALTSILSGTAPFNGRFRPYQPLSVLDGQIAFGSWRLQISDVASGNAGRLLSWGITATLNNGRIYTYNWSVLDSGFFGQSDNVVFRMQGVPAIVTGTKNATPGPYLYGAYASSTFPFRVRGTQVRVVTPTITSTLPVSQAIVYRLPKGQSLNAQAMANSAGDPFRTDGQGYLQGRGRLDIGDTLIALYPVHSQYRDGSLTFDGVNDSVGVISPTVPILNSSYTLAALIKPSLMGSHGIVGWGNYGATNQVNALRLTNNGLVNYWWGNDLNVVTGPLTDTWHYVAATFDGVTRRLYLDGSAVGSDTPTGHAVPDSRNFQIGSTNGSEYFDGEIGEISIWNVARSQSELQADMAHALKGNEPGLVGYWRFDEGAGNIAHDQTANHNDGPLSGPTWNGGGEQYTVYHTSAAPNSTGLSMTTVVSPGVQTLVVTSSNSLVLFNLDVALEWDARQDKQFLSQLDHDLQRTSEVLFDWSNGQAALGKVNVYFDRDHWDEADVQIYATNRLRPNAAQGGIVTDWLVDPITATRVITYEAGQVSMGAVWNRYGESSGNLGEDWPRALAHELGHYALFLDDDYLGLDANNRLIPIDTCSGTAMSDPYRDDYSEFHPGGASWTTNCASTLAAKETGRWDWATVTTFYPWLKSAPTNTGPSGLPLDVTTINFVEPISPTTVLPTPIFNLTQNGGQVQPGTSARVFLYHDDQVTDLGNPTLDQVEARGARLGDLLCVYDLSAQRLGCETITAGDEELALVSKPDWQPDILVTPVNSRTFNLSVSVAGLSPIAIMQARLYPLDGVAPAAIPLARMPSFRVYLPVVLRASSNSSLMIPLASGEGNAAAVNLDRYVGTFTLDDPAPQGYVQVWVNEPDQRRESVVEYALGGSPAYLHGRGAYLHGRGAYLHGRGAYLHGRGAYLHGRGAPTASPDGQVVLFADGLVFDYGEFFALQAVTVLPNPPAGASLVGQAYNLLRSTNAPSLVGTSLSFYYAGRDVPPGEEDFLSVRFWNGIAWQKLATTVDTEHNIAVATVPSTANGVGVYALMSSIEIPLYGPGWNPFSYPAQGSKPVVQALASINGSYGIVYGTVLTDTLDPWKVSAVNVPAWVNDLTTLDFGKTYWISVTQTITLEVTGGGTSAPSSVEGLPSPPMTVYGTASASGTVTAWINGVPCGQGATKLINNQIVYTLNIQPDAPGGKLGCGAAGRSVTFKIGSQAMSTTVGWDIDRVRNLPLAP